MDTVSKPFYTVGQLREMLEGIPDDRMVTCQVVAANGRAWNLHAAFSPTVPRSTSNMAVLTLTHPQLKTLPENNEE